MDERSIRVAHVTPVDPVDAWLGGTWMDDPDFHDGYSEIRLRREPEVVVVLPSVERKERAAKPAPTPAECPHCGLAFA